VRLGALQILGLFARPSFIPMLGMPALAELVRSGPLRLRLRRGLRGAVLFGLLPALGCGAIVKLLGIEHTLWMWQSAHQPKYLPPDRVRALLSSLLLAGGPYLLLGAFALRRAAWRGTTIYLHLAWIALYVSFLFFGGASLWPRYFAPIVPSVVIVATPALDALVRRRRTAAIVLVAAIALWHLARVARWCWSAILP
jgi:hypothetical protein